MAKRSNPYTEDFIQQTKTHVSLKVFNNNEDRLQKVYGIYPLNMRYTTEKTLELLFKGAKKMENDSLKTNNNFITQRKKDGKKQLFIGNDGTLLHSGFTVSEVTNACECPCGNLKSEDCAYCESVLCTLCRHHCLQCLQYYCSKCTLTGLDNLEKCVSCYS